MGLVLSNLSGSYKYKDSRGRSAVSVTGSTYFYPVQPGAVGPNGATPTALLPDLHKDAAYVFSGSAGSNVDKVLFLGDVHISGSLTGFSGQVETDAGAGDRRVGFYNGSADVLSGDVDFVFSASGPTFGEIPALDHGGLVLGNNSGDAVSISLGGGDLNLFTGPTNDGTEKAGIYVGTSQQLAITGSGGPGTAGVTRVSTVLGGANSVLIGAGTNHATTAGRGDVRLMATGITGSAMAAGFLFSGAQSSVVSVQDGALQLSAAGTDNGDGISVVGRDLALVSNRDATGGLVVESHASGDIDLQIGTGQSKLKVDTNSIDTTVDVVLGSGATVNGNDASRVLFAAMDGNDVDLSLGAGANVVMGGILKLASAGKIQDSNGDDRITAAQGADTLIAGDGGTTVVTVNDSLVTVATALDASGKVEILDATDASSAADANASLHTDGGAAITKSAFVGGNLTVDGDLEIKGQSTVIDTENLVVEDPLVVLGSSSGSFAAAGDRGFVFAQGAAKNGSPVMFWNNGGIVNDSPTGTFEFVLANASGSESSITPLGANGSAHLDIQAGDALLKGVKLNKADTAGDVAIEFQQGGTTSYVMGIDDSDSNVWKLHSHSSLQDSSDVKLATDGVLTVASLVATTADINAGTVDGADITVGTGKTLDVSGGTLTLGNDQISGDKINGGTIGSVTIGQLAGALDANNVAITNVDINSGAIDGVVIGASTAADGTFDDIIIANDGVIFLAGDGSPEKITCNSGNNVSINAGGNVVFNAGGNILPENDNATDLGSADLRWANIFTGDLNLRNDRGDWTLIEEENFISFRNNVTGRRFRMVMEDITGTGTYGPGNDGEM